MTLYLSYILAAIFCSLTAAWAARLAYNVKQNENYEEIADYLEDQVEVLTRKKHRVSQKSRIVVKSKRLTAVSEEVVCPLCQDSLGSGVQRCVGCGAIYHCDCLEELSAGKCATLGCARQLTNPDLVIPETNDQMNEVRAQMSELRNSMLRSLNERV